MLNTEMQSVKLTSESELDTLERNCVAYINDLANSQMVINAVGFWMKMQLRTSNGGQLHFRSYWGDGGWSEWKQIL